MSKDVLPDRLDGRPFSTQEALAAGLGRRDLETPGTVRRVIRGLYVPAWMPQDDVATARALLAAAPGGSVVSGVVALREAGILLPASMQDCREIEIVTPWYAWDRRQPFLRTRRTTLPIRLRSPGIAHPAYVLAHMGAGPWSLEDLVVVGDQATRRVDPPATVQELTDALAEAGPIRGKRRVAHALDLVRPGTDSPPETIMRLHVVEVGLPCPQVNAPIWDADGAFVAMPDLSWPEYRVAAEYDGVWHRTSDVQRRLDNQRLRAMRAAGWEVVVATADDLGRPGRFLADLSAVLAARGLRAA